MGRSAEDESILKFIGDPTLKEVRSTFFIRTLLLISNFIYLLYVEGGSANQTSAVNVHIYDARPYMNAVGNMVTGKGFEKSNNYVNCEVFFLNIHNIHKVRESYNQIINLCLSEDKSNWLNLLD